MIVEPASEAERLSSRHIPALDGIRGLAILLVIPHNSSLMGTIGYHGAGYLIKEVVSSGWAGVQLFFVLSGFLISGFLLDTQRASNYYSAFYARRALRILPLYFGVLAVTFLILAPHGWLPARTLASAPHQVWLWTFLSSWMDTFGRGVWGFAHFWSLSIEEQFYLLWPFVLHRLAPRRVALLCVGIAIVALGIRSAMLSAGSSWLAIYEFPPCRMDALALGSAAAAALRVPEWTDRLPRPLPMLQAAGIALIAVGALATRGYPVSGSASLTLGQSMLAVAFTFWVFAAATARPESRASRLLSLRPLRSVGKYSYGMYVFHYPLQKWFGSRAAAQWGIAPSAAADALYYGAIVLASYGLAWLSYRLYERHFLDLKKLFAPRSNLRAASL